MTPDDQRSFSRSVCCMDAPVFQTSKKHTCKRQPEIQIIFFFPPFFFHVRTTRGSMSDGIASFKRAKVHEKNDLAEKPIYSIYALRCSFYCFIPSYFKYTFNQASGGLDQKKRREQEMGEILLAFFFFFSVQ